MVLDRLLYLKIYCNYYCSTWGPKYVYYRKKQKTAILYIPNHKIDEPSVERCLWLILSGFYFYFSALPFFVELSFQPSNSNLNFTPAVFDWFQQYWLMLTFPGPLCSKSADLFTFHRWSLHGFRGNNNKNTIFICRMHYVLFATFLPKNKAQSCIAPTKVRYWRACFTVWQCTRNSAVVSHVLAARRFHLHGVASRNCLLPTGELTRVNSFA